MWFVYERMAVCLLVYDHRNRKYLAMFYLEHIMKDSGGPSRTFGLEFQTCSRSPQKDQVAFERFNRRALYNKQSLADRQDAMFVEVTQLGLVQNK